MADQDDPRQVIDGILGEAAALHEQVRRLDLQPVLSAAEAMVRALGAGGQVLAFGNGGSASDAEHLAAELVGRFNRERCGWPAVALTADSSVVTAIGNDFGFDQVFARQVEALGRRGDIAFGISTSGASANVLAGFEAAERGGLVRVALTGRDGGALGRAADIHVNVPHDTTARVQEVHRTLLHVLCELVERGMIDGQA